jgi:hypothetical protein
VNPRPVTSITNPTSSWVVIIIIIANKNGTRGAVHAPRKEPSRPMSSALQQPGVLCHGEQPCPYQTFLKALQLFHGTVAACCSALGSSAVAHLGTRIWRVWLPSSINHSLREHVPARPAPVLCLRNKSWGQSFRRFLRKDDVAPAVVSPIGIFLNDFFIRAAKTGAGMGDTVKQSCAGGSQ